MSGCIDSINEAVKRICLAWQVGRERVAFMSDLRAAEIRGDDSEFSDRPRDYRLIEFAVENVLASP